MTTMTAPPSALWYPEVSKMSKPDQTQTPHDVVLAVSDLKRFAGWSFSILTTVLIGIGVHFNSRLVEVERKNATQDAAVSGLVKSAEFEKSNRERIERLLETAQEGQRHILEQFSELRPKVSAIEEIARSTQGRLETIANYLRDTKKEVIQNYDSSRATRP